MSDSDEEPIPNNGNTFQNGHISTHSGYNSNMAKTMGLSFQNNFSSILNMRPDFRRNNYGRLDIDQKSIYHRRETSPMSLRSVPDFARHNMQHSYYQNEMSSQHSMFNPRSGSPMSMRTIDTTTSVSAVDIVDAFKNVKFNKYDLRLIKEAYNKFFRNRVRKRIEKRRKLKLLFKYNRKKSGDDSGEQGSDSSSSSNDRRSIRSIRSEIPKENILRHKNRRDIVQFKNKENDMYQDLSQNFKNICYKNGRNNYESSIPNDTRHGKMVESQGHRFNSDVHLPSHRSNDFSNQLAMMNANVQFTNSHKDNEHCHTRDVINQRRYVLETKDNQIDSEKEGLLVTSTDESYSTKILSQSSTTAVRNILNENVNSSVSILSNNLPGNNNNNDFNFKRPQLPLLKPQMPFKMQLMSQKVSIPKRLLAKSTPIFSNFNSSHIKQKGMQTVNRINKKCYEPIINVNGNECSKDVRGAISSNDLSDTDNDIFSDTTVRENSTMCSSNAQKRVLDDIEIHICNKRYKRGSPEKQNENIISRNFKSGINNVNKTQNLQNNLNKCNNQNNTSNIEQNDLDISRKNIEIDSNTSSTMRLLSSSDISMKPSFIKRKLFTQKLDIIENKNANSDNLVNSPQTNKNFREKNKVRKLATSQSCLSRDVHDDNDDKVLNLIHKIVPPDQINMTNTSNKILRKSKPDDDKWDVESIISMCNNDDISETYTDEEVFAIDKDIFKSKEITESSLTKPQNTAKNHLKSIQTNKCKIVIEKLPDASTYIQSKKDETESKCPNKRTVSGCMGLFWDTDFESDMEDRNDPSWKPIKSTNQGKFTKESAMNSNNKKRPLRGTMLTLSSLKNSFISSVRAESCHVPNQKLITSVEQNNNVSDKNIESSTSKEQTITNESSTISNKNDQLDKNDLKDNTEKVKKGRAKNKPFKENQFNESIIVTSGRLKHSFNSSTSIDSCRNSVETNKDSKASTKKYTTINNNKGQSSVSNRKGRANKSNETKVNIKDNAQNGKHNSNKKNEIKVDSTVKLNKNVTDKNCTKKNKQAIVATVEKKNNHLNKSSIITRSHKKKPAGLQRKKDDLKK